MSSYQWSFSLIFKLTVLMLAAVLILGAVLFYYWVITESLPMYLRVSLLIMIGSILIWAFYSRLKLGLNKTKIPKTNLP